MRAFCVLAVLLAGCQFSVIGSATGDPAAGAAAPAPGGMTQPQSPPTSSAPPPGITDAGVAPVDVDMSVQRVGTACTADAQCDPGLICAKTFYVGLTRIDIPGGYCTLDCSQNANACPASSYCGSFNFGKYCLSNCPPDPCRKGYQCCDNSGQKGCTPATLCKE